jgi:chromosome segregation ATPase
MANQKQDILSRLADKGEGALSRVAGSQTTARVVESVTGLRERMDDVQKKVRGLDELEKRVTELEKQLAELQKPKAKPKTTRSASSSARKSTPTTPKPPS